MMSNLENLTQKVLDDAKSKASIIEKESKKENKTILDSRNREANEEKKRILSRATSEADLLKERTISNAKLSVRDEKLIAKQEVIERTFNMARERLKNLSEDKYITYLKDTLKDIELKGGETIIIPKRMEAKVRELDFNIKISEDETVDSGFILIDKETTLNYTFDSLVEHYRDEMEVEIAQSLFKE